MNYIKYSLFQFARWIILVVSILLLMLSMYMLLAMMFRLPTAFKTGNNPAIAFENFSQAIPAKTTLFTTLMDTSITTGYNNGQQPAYYAPIPVDTEFFKKGDTVLTYTDTIWTHYNEPYTSNIGVQPLNIVDMNFNEGTVYIQPANFRQKIAFGLPYILYTLLLSLIGLQVFRLISAIYKRTFFEERNYRMLASIGWALIGYNVIVYLLEQLKNASGNVNVSFSSTIENYRMPFSINGSLQSHVSFEMLIIGVIMLVFARAFKIGYNLQKDQSLFV